MRHVLIGGLIIFLLAGCGASDYPDEWPSPDPGWLSRKGGCPDLTGDYSPVNSELDWLLSANPDFHVARQAWSEHHARIEQAEDGRWLTISMRLNSHGFDDYRARMLEHNFEQNGLPIGGRIELKIDEDYRCSGGWLIGLRFAQTNKDRGIRRHSLSFRRDKEGGLIAGAELEIDQSIGWADSRSISLGSSKVTRWYRWPLRDSSDQAALLAKQGVDVRRYPWVNGGTRVPIRFTSFVLEPICVRFYDKDYAIPVRGPERIRGRDDTRPPEPECPKAWGKFDFGEVFRQEWTLLGDYPRNYRIEWFVLGTDERRPEVIRIANAAKLPMMPKRK